MDMNLANHIVHWTSVTVDGIFFSLYIPF